MHTHTLRVSNEKGAKEEETAHLLASSIEGALQIVDLAEEVLLWQ